MKIPTQKQIDAEIKRLTELKALVPPQSIFGGDNIAKLNAQIEVLENHLDEDQVYSRTQYEDDESTHDNEWSQDESSCAIEAVQWLAGDAEEKPSAGWESLAKSARTAPKAKAPKKK